MSITALAPAPSPELHALSIVSSQRTWTPEQNAALTAIGLGACPDPDRLAYLHLCQETGLDPFRREIYLLARKSKIDGEWVERWVAQTGIDGFRHLAAETGVYGGVLSTDWCGDDGEWRDVWLPRTPPAACRVVIARVDRGTPESAVVLFREFVAERDGKPTGQWASKPVHMLAKVAEAYAIRRAFPRQTSGLQSEDAMQQQDVIADREEQREKLTSRPWANRGGVILGQDQEPIDVEPEPTPPTRAELWDELQQQARIYAMPLDVFTRRWRTTHGVNIADATDEQLAEQVAKNRAATVDRLARVLDAAWDDAHAAPATDTPDVAAEAAPVTSGAAATVTEPEGHPYASADGTLDGPCVECGRGPMSEVHAP